MIECVYCTVPTDNPSGVCRFCADYKPPTAPNDPAQEIVGIADAANELAISESLLISMLADSGLLLVIPGTEDERCGEVTRVPELGVPLPLHVDGCGCRFIASPHPDIALRGDEVPR